MILTAESIAMLYCKGSFIIYDWGGGRGFFSHFKGSHFYHVYGYMGFYKHVMS